MEPEPESTFSNSILTRANAYFSPGGFALAPGRLRELFLAGVAGFATENPLRIISTTRLPDTKNPAWLLVGVTLSLLAERGLPAETIVQIRHESGGPDILLRIEDDRGGWATSNSTFDGYTPTQVGYHAYLH